jgi:hypothetical protein
MLCKLSLPIVGLKIFSPRLLIQYIRSYPSYLEAVCSIRNLRTRHEVVTGDPLNTEKETSLTHLKDTVAFKISNNEKKPCYSPQIITSILKVFRMKYLKPT